jgi:hypothetical protein
MTLCSLPGREQSVLDGDELCIPMIDCREASVVERLAEALTAAAMCLAPGTKSAVPKNVRLLDLVRFAGEAVKELMAAAESKRLWQQDTTGATTAATLRSGPGGSQRNAGARTRRPARARHAAKESERQCRDILEDARRLVLLAIPASAEQVPSRADERPRGC